METPYIINTHSHVNMLKELSAEQAVKNCKDENITIIVPSYDDKSIFRPYEAEKSLEINDSKKKDGYSKRGIFGR